MIDHNVSLFGHPNFTTFTFQNLLTNFQVWCLKPTFDKLIDIIATVVCIRLYHGRIRKELTIAHPWCPIKKFRIKTVRKLVCLDIYIIARQTLNCCFALFLIYALPDVYGRLKWHNNMNETTNLQ